MHSIRTSNGKNSFSVPDLPSQLDNTIHIMVSVPWFWRHQISIATISPVPIPKSTKWSKWFWRLKKTAGGLCDFGPRDAAAQGRSRKATAPYTCLDRCLVWHRDTTARVKLEAARDGNAAASLNCRAHVGCGFKRLSCRYWKMPHAVCSMLKLSWSWNARL